MNRSVLFNLVRRLLGRGFQQSEVHALDAAIDAMIAAIEPGTPANRPRVASAAGTALVKRFEGCGRRRADGTMEAYPDPGTGGAPWTIGWGATGPDIGSRTVWSQVQCDARLDADLARHARDVDRALGDAPTSQNQFDALLSFHFNTGAIARATLTRKHCAGDYSGAAAEFARWNRAGGRILPGLTKRREAEARLYASGQTSRAPPQ